MKLRILGIFFLSSISYAKFESPFLSTVDGLSIPNAHLVATRKNGGQLYRGMEPGDRVDELFTLGITDVIILKNQIKDEVDRETERLLEQLSENRILHVPLRYKNVESFGTACRQLVTALKQTRAVLQKKGRKLFFHCTVGEDRTGLLAGLVRMLEQNWTIKKAFYREMCENGYASGNPEKAKNAKKVVTAIYEELNPVFTKMAYKILQGEISWSTLDLKTCSVDPANQPEYSENPIYDPDHYRCRTSSKYPR